MEIHNLKSLPEVFKQIEYGLKNFEIRKNDEDFKVGDQVFLHEWDQDKKDYTGKCAIRYISYITDHEQKDGYVVFGISKELSSVCG